MNHLEENEELYRAWVGTKNQEYYMEKLKSGGFDFTVFFLAEIQLIFRKMFLETFLYIAFIVIIVISLEAIGASNEVYTLVSCAIAVARGILFYPLYRWHIKRKIEKYKKQGLSYEEQLEIAEKKGGEKVTVAVVVIFIAVIAIIPVIALGIVIFNEAQNTVNNSYYNRNEYNNSDYYNMSYNDDKYNEITNSIDNNKEWDLDYLNLTYNGNEWSETSILSYKALQ